MYFLFLTDAVRLAFNSVTVNNLLIHTSVGTVQPKSASIVGETASMNEHARKTVISLAAVSVDGNATPATESEEEKAKKLLYCSLCKVAVNSLSQLEAHNTGWCFYNNWIGCKKSALLSIMQCNCSIVILERT